MTGDVLMAAATIVRERVRRSVVGVVGGLWLAGTLVLVAAIVPLSVDKPDEKLTQVYWAAFPVAKQDRSEPLPEERPPPEFYPENAPWPPPDLDEEVAQLITGAIADWVLAFGGMVFVLMVTCNFFTAATERGRVELLLSRPLPRSVVLLSHYAAGVLFATVLFGTTIGLTFLAIWLRLGVAVGGYLITLPILVGMFAVLHAVQTLAAAAWRSWFLALLLPFVIWGASFCFESGRSFVRVFRETQQAAAEMTEKHGGPNEVQKLQAAPMQGLILQTELPVNIFYHALPKASEFDNLNTWAIYGRDQLRREMEDYSPWVTILSSAAWMAVCLVLACVRFHFREF